MQLHTYISKRSASTATQTYTHTNLWTTIFKFCSQYQKYSQGKKDSNYTCPLNAKSIEERFWRFIFHHPSYIMHKMYLNYAINKTYNMAQNCFLSFLGTQMKWLLWTPSVLDKYRQNKQRQYALLLGETNNMFPDKSVSRATGQTMTGSLNNNMEWSLQTHITKFKRERKKLLFCWATEIWKPLTAIITINICPKQYKSSGKPNYIS